MLLLALLIVILQGDIMHKVNSNHPQPPGRLRCGQEAAEPDRGTPTQDLQPWISSQNHKVKRLVLSQHVYQVEPSQVIVGSDLVPYTAPPHTTNLHKLSQYSIQLTCIHNWHFSLFNSSFHDACAIPDIQYICLVTLFFK